MSVFEDFSKTVPGGGTGITDVRQAQFVGPSAGLAGVPFWGDHPGLWDVVRLAGVTLPGIASVGGDIEHRVDRRRIPGEHGERITHLGCKPAELEIHLRMWTAEHLKAFEQLVPLIRPKPKAAPPDPVDIVHPATHLYGIKSVQILRVGLPQQVGDSDIYEVRLRGIEYVPPKAGGSSKVKTPKAPLSIKALAPDGGALTSSKPSTTQAGPGVSPGQSFADYLKGGGK